VVSAKEAARRVARLVSEELAGPASEAAARQAFALMRLRVFNRGEDVNGGRRGYKSDRYKAIRSAQGRQSSYINFQLTGQLRDSMLVARKGDAAVIGMAGIPRTGENIDNAELAGYLKDRFPDYWKLNDNEREQATEAAARFVRDRVVAALQGAS